MLNHDSVGGFHKMIVDTRRYCSFTIVAPPGMFAGERARGEGRLWPANPDTTQVYRCNNIFLVFAVSLEYD